MTIFRFCSAPFLLALAGAVAVQATSAGFLPRILVPLSPTRSLLAAEPVSDDIREIGTRRELFVDDAMIESLDAAELRMHHPVRRNVILEIDQPWEKLWQPDSPLRKSLGIADAEKMDPTVFGYSTVLRDGDLYRLYYSWDRDALPSLTGYAESRDGISWTKPKLGLVEFAGSRDNNLIWTDGHLFDFTPFVDRNPRCRPDQKYKTIAGGPPIALVSADGLRWHKLQQEPVLTDGAFDSQNIAFWDHERQKYVAWYRDNINGVRMIKYATSDDFIHWTKGELLDYGDVAVEQFYTNAIAQYAPAPHLYVGLPMRFLPSRHPVAEHAYPGVSDVVLMTSRDGLHWDRPFRQAFIRPGTDRENWTDRNFLVTWGMVQTSPEETSLYWVEHYRHPTNRIVRGTIRTDGFASLHAGYADGTALTRPLIFSGRRLLLNYSTSAAGSVRVELLTAAGEPIAGFSGTHAGELFGDRISGEYRWKSDSDLSSLAWQLVRLRFHLKDADIFAFQFVP